MNITKKCPGPGYEDCRRKANSGPKGGRCRECNTIRKRETALAWARENYRSRNPEKTFNKIRAEEEIQIARRATEQPSGLRGAMRVIQAMQRAAS